MWMLNVKELKCGVRIARQTLGISLRLTAKRSLSIGLVASAVIGVYGINGARL